jgi:hypothetical protein
LDDTFTFSQRDGKRVVIKAVFPYQGLFHLNVFAKEKTEAGNYPSVLEYMVHATQTPTSKLGFPKTYAAFDTAGAYLYRPRAYHLKAGQAYSFKIKVPGAIKVAVIDENGWHYLDNKNQVFSGMVSAKKGEISLSAKLDPDKNSYATLVEFQAE